MNWFERVIEAFSLPELVSQDGGQIDGLIIIVHVLMAALFVGWTIYYFIALYKFRASNNPTADYKGVRSKKITNSIEGAVIVAELLLLVVATYFWNFIVNKPADEGEATKLRVTAQQFAWNARYPGQDGELGKQDPRFVSGDNPFGLDLSDENGRDDVEVLNSDIIVPMLKNEEGKVKSVIVDLTSKDVIHCFKVPPLRVCQDVIPGLKIPIHFKPTKPGRYMVTCAQLCGDGHARMRGYIRVVDEAEWNKWYGAEQDKKKSDSAPKTSALEDEGNGVALVDSGNGSGKG